MSLYLPLDPEKNEVRMLRIVEPGSGKNSSLVHCELETVSIDALSPEFKNLLGTRRFTSSISEEWLKECQEGASTIGLPLWRVVEDYGGLYHNTWSAAVDLAQLADLAETIFGITSDSSNCYSVSGVSGINAVDFFPLLRNKTKEAYFPLTPRFQWGDYEAISYCWESEELERKIVVNKTVVQVPKNLEALLQRLQNIPEAKLGMMFWIDALCINQKSLEEKNHQVKLMKSIYSKAFAVLVWLGDAADESDQVVDYISSLALENMGIEEAWLMWWKRSFPEDCKIPLNIEEELMPAMPWKSLLHFLSRNYWKRLWIIQELALNHNMTLFLCGKQQVSRRMILQGCSFMATKVERIDCLIRDQMMRGEALPGLNNRSIWTTVSRVESLLDMKHIGIELSGILDICRKAKAKDPKDKIYGLLGLLPSSIAAQIHPDYELFKVDVYIQFAKTLLGVHKGLEAVLSWCYYSESEKLLPSWVPDWTTNFTRNHVGHLRNRNACGLESAHWSLSKDLRHLSVTGFLADSVCSVSQSPSQNLPYGISKPKQPEETWDTATQNILSLSKVPAQPLRHKYNDLKSLAMALARTLFLLPPGYRRQNKHPRVLEIYWIDWNEEKNTGENHQQLQDMWDWMSNLTVNSAWESFDQFRQTNAEFSIFGYPLRDFFPCMTSFISRGDFPTIPAWRESFQRSKAQHQKTSWDMKITTLSLVGRRLITTNTGYLGLAPEAVKEGDVIAIVYGCNFPVALRQCGDFYQVIGECYIDGMMDGELIKAKSWGEFEEQTLVLC